MSLKNQKHGAEAFENYYSALYGPRWQELRRSLLSENSSRAFFSADSTADPYFLDAGSVLAASVLPLEHAENILDMCAAPGGKSLILASRMPPSALLCCNDRSAPRSARLSAVLNTRLPPDIRSRVSVTSRDASLLCRKNLCCYDAVLLDAPCSSERHIICSEEHLARWTPARIKNLTFAQWALLSSAFLMVKAGGYILYSTCALTDDENDKIIAKLIKKYRNAQIVFPDISSLIEFSPYKPLPVPEKTKFGFHVMPDVCGGAGPLYFSLIRKMPASGENSE